MNRTEMVVLTVIVIAIGTLMHFVHELPFFNNTLGYFFPVNECAWEHMKMIFYPMLLAAIYMCLSNHGIEYFGGMILASIIAIPVMLALFYCYFPFTHHSVLIADIILYVGVMSAAVYFGAKWSFNPWIQKNWILFIGLALGVSGGLSYLTYHAPDNFMFRV